MGRFLSKVWAFVRRDFLHELSYRLRFFFQLYGIFFGVTLFYFIAKLVPEGVNHLLEGTGYFSFALVGIAFLGFMSSGMTTYAASLREAQMMGTLEAMLVTPTPLSTIVMASAVYTYLRGSLMVLGYLVVGMVFGMDLSQANLLAAALVVVLAVLAFSSLGVLSAAFTLAFKRGDPVTALFGGMQALLGGAFFPVKVLPPWVQKLSELIPLKHALDGMRGALLNGQGPIALGRPIALLALFAASLMPLAILAFRMAVRKAKRDGSLAQY